VDGVLIVDKPEQWTSHDVVARVRRLANTKKVGHLGTLDPMATGVLPLVIGCATRLAQFFGRDRKVYEGVIRLGYSTDSYDREGKPISEPVEPVVSREQLEKALDCFRGTFEQTPPPVSAKKVGGTPAYKFARNQTPVELKPVTVTVSSLKVLDFDGRDARIYVECTAGTYVRGIAHDTGQMLGCGAFLQSLRRLASGDFAIESAHTLDRIAELASEGRLAEATIKAPELLPEFTNEHVDPFTAGQIRQGRDFRVSPFRVREGRYVKAITAEGDLVAIGEAVLPNVYHPILVFQGGAE
jgi:tRNA pseudouridine55 synthase